LSLEYVITSIFLTRLEILFLQRFFDKENVGFYAVALTLANLALQLPVQLTGSLMPYYSEKLEASGQRRLPIDMFAGVVRSLAYITLPMSFGLAAISEELVTSVFGAEFTPAGAIVAILALATPVFVFSQLCTQYLFSQGQIKTRLLVDFIGSAIIVGGCLLFVPLYGGPGAAVVRAFSFVAMCLFMASAMEFDGSIAHVFRTLLPVTLAALVCGAVAEANVLLIGGLAGLILAIPAGALAYILALRLFKAVPEGDVDALMKLADRFPGKLKRGLIAVVHFVAPHARRAAA
jgi:O-antigen/teichoic acid export membrane protein